MRRRRLSSYAWVLALVSFASAVAGARTASASETLPLPGHNLFSTTYILPDGVSSAGSYYVGRGFGDYAMIATSPWLWLNYNMVNLEAKIAVPLRSNTRVSLEALGFKTFQVPWAGYVQESAFMRGTASHRFTSEYALHFGAGYQYFWNDEFAFSLRPIPWNSDRYTISAGTLHEISLGTDRGLFVEAGVLGLNYRLPFWHVGLSFHRRYRWGYLQIGISMSGRRSASVPPEPEGYREWLDWRRTYLDDEYSDYYVQWMDSLEQRPIAWRKFFVHPEIQVQFPL